MNDQDFVPYIRSYALAHYDQGGWAYVVEAWSDSDIMSYLKEANGNAIIAFVRIRAAVNAVNEYETEIRNA